MLFSPIRVAIAGLLVWALLWLVSPLRMMMEIQWNTIIYITLCYVAFAAGCGWVIHFQTPQNDTVAILDRPIYVGKSLSSRLYWYCVAGGFLAMGLRVFDRIVLRGVSYAADSASVRDALSNTGFSVYSAIGSILMPFCFIPLLLLISAGKKRGKYAKYIIAILLFSLPILESLAQLSRSVLLLTIAFGVVATSLLRFKGQVFQARFLIPMLVSALALLLISSVIFTQRLSDYNRNLDDSLVTSAYAEAFIPNEDAMMALHSQNGLKAQFYESYLPASMYYLSGFYELDLLLNRPDEQGFASGRYMFDSYIRIYDMLFGSKYAIDTSYDSQYIYRNGVFTSFFGTIWVDFGYLSIIFMCIFGYICQKLSVIIKRKEKYMPLYTFFMVATFYMPVVNFVTMGFGFFMIHGFLVYLLGYDRLNRNDVPL
jgi:hypothetical protein